MSRFTLKNIDLSENSRKAEHILILKIAAVAPLDNDNIKNIFAVGKQICNVNLARAMADLAVSRKLAVDIEIKAGGNSLKIYVIAFAALFIKAYSAPVMPRRVFIGHIWRVKRERIKKIAVKRSVISFSEPCLPAGRHGNFIRQSRGKKILADIFK